MARSHLLSYRSACFARSRRQSPKGITRAITCFTGPSTTGPTEFGFECLQVPTQSKRPRQNTVQSSPVQWIIPHKAPLFMLETCLRAVGDSRGSTDIVSVCFDEEVNDEHHELAARFPWAEFYRSEPHSNGPYVGRERLVRSSPTPIVLFQDSDDAPTLSRRQVLLYDGRIQGRPHRLPRDTRE